MEKTRKDFFINLVLVLLFSILFFGIILVKNGAVYYANDDICMKEIASGVYTGTPSQHLVFSSFPYSTMLMIMFNLYNKIDWYSLFFIFSTFFYTSCTIFFIIKELKNSLEKIIFIPFLYYIYSFLLPNAFVSYTFTKVSAYIIACSLILYLLPHNKFKNIIIGIGIIISYSIRSYACAMILVFFVPAYLYKNLDNKDILKRDFKFGLSVALLLLVCILVNKCVLYNSPEWKSYLEYNKYRAEYFDYYRSHLDTPEAEEIYTKAGFTEKDRFLLDNLCIGFDESLKDKTINLVEICKQENISRGNDVFHYLRNLFTKKTGITYLISTLALLIVCLKHNKKALLFTILQLLILAFLIMNGRVPERVYMPLFFAFISTNIIIIFNNTKIVEYILKIVNYNSLSKIVLCLLSIILFCSLVFKVYLTDDDKAFFNFNLIALNYMSNHQENFYLYNHFELEPLSIKNKYTVSNYINIGGWSIYSPLYYEKLKTRGVNSINDLITQDNVYIILPTDFNSSHFNELSDNVTIEKIDEIEKTYIVYKINK